MKFSIKKNQTQSEMQWRKDRSDERWEKRADYLMGFFSQVTTSLPRQISHQNSIKTFKIRDVALQK